MFIVLEGVDGCGKSTQAKLLADWLKEKGDDVHLTAEPSASRIGQFVREILSSEVELEPDALALLFTADRIHHLADDVEPALLQDKIVVSERYYYSTIAYQHTQGVDWDWLVNLNDFRRPDVAVLLDVPPEKAADKIREKIEREKMEADEARKKFESEKDRFEAARKKFHDVRLTFHRYKKNPYAQTGAQGDKKLKNYFDSRNARGAQKHLEALMADLLELDEARMAAMADYEAARTKYLKFEKFERPTTLESDADGYEAFLEKVHANYRRFDDLTVVDGTQSIDKVAADIQEIVGAVL